MKNIQTSIITQRMADEIGAAVEKMNKYIAPENFTGELIMAIPDGEAGYKIILHVCLDWGIGDSCAMRKIQTLVNHPECNWGGSLDIMQMGPTDEKWYGSIRLVNCHGLAGDRDWRGEMLIAFSDRKEWQDVLYVAAVLYELRDILRMDFELPNMATQDPVWGTALNLVDAIFKK